MIGQIVMKLTSILVIQCKTDLNLRKRSEDWYGRHLCKHSSTDDPLPDPSTGTLI